MRKERKHPVTSWEVSMIEVIDCFGSKFKVTRRIPSMCVAETKVFRSKKKAKKQFEDWLS